MRALPESTQTDVMFQNGFRDLRALKGRISGLIGLPMSSDILWPIGSHVLFLDDAGWSASGLVCVHGGIRAGEKFIDRLSR